MENEICKQCGRKLVVKATKKSAAQLKKAFYYSAYYYCNYCQKLYHDEKFKVVNGQLDLSSWSGKGHDRISQDGDSIAAPDAAKVPASLQNDKNGVHIWTDGACTNNGYPNAKAAWAFVAHSAGSASATGEEEQAGLVPGKQTNNRAEGLAVYYALKWAAEKGYKKVKLHTDSQISLFNLAKPAYKVVANREIFEQIEKVIIDNSLDVTYVKVLGHSGDPNNERADKLANGLATAK